MRSNKKTRTRFVSEGCGVVEAAITAATTTNPLYGLKVVIKRRSGQILLFKERNLFFSSFLLEQLADFQIRRRGRQTTLESFTNGHDARLQRKS